MIDYQLFKMFNSIPHEVVSLVPILSLYIACWVYCIKGLFVSDDIDGIAKFSESFQPEQITPDGKVIEEKKIDTYEENGKTWKMTQFNNSIPFPASIIRWLRLNIGKKWTIIGKNKKGHEVTGYIQDFRKHHIINLTIQAINITLAYFLLDRLFGSKIAFMTCLLFAVYPLGCQTVAWISGIGYLSCLTGILAVLNLVTIFPETPLTLIGVTLGATFASSGLLVGCALWVILVMLGKYWAALFAFIPGIVILLKQGKLAVDFRKKAFREQNMGRSTYINPRKAIVIMKTIYYYVRMMVFPKRLGLFHKWGYHYEDSLERIDGMFWKGLLCVIAIVYSVFFSNFAFPIKFGVLWFIVMLYPFINLITAQQFVADRYAFIPSFGYCLILSYFLQDYAILYSFLVGLMLMRTWVHLPTFDNEIKFYQSNIFNFPDSEVAYGNLGVICASKGLNNWAIDAWKESARINDFYDVPHYNLYSAYKANRLFNEAKAELYKCLNAKTVHFENQWKVEMEKLEKVSKIHQDIAIINNEMNIAINTNNNDLMTACKQKMAIANSLLTNIQNEPTQVKS